MPQNPEVVFIAVTRPAGKPVSIMQYVVTGNPRPPTDINIAFELTRAIPDFVSWRRIVKEAIPETREFRNDWIDGGDVVRVKPGLVGARAEAAYAADNARVSVAEAAKAARRKDDFPGPSEPARPEPPQPAESRRER